MPVEDNLKRMSFHSEASLLSRSTLDHETQASSEMWSEIPLHSDFSQPTENSGRLTTTTHRTQTAPALSIPSTNDQFSFRKAVDVTRHKSELVENQSRTSKQTSKVRPVPPSGIAEETRINRGSGSSSRKELSRDCCDSTRGVTMQEHDSAVSELLLNARDLADPTQVSMTVDLENRAQDIVDRVMAGVMCQEAKVISARGETALGFDYDEPTVILHEENEKGHLNTRL